ncbi:MAG: phage tail protein, partial [Pseudomonadota bacterium]
VFGIGNSRIEGPRKDDLSVQSAAFGRAIPVVYGTGRYAGNVIWSTGLIETREEESQSAKGGPKVTNVTYTYASSFAVGLCQGPILDIGRVWADGKLLREASGTLSVAGAMRVYRGNEDQAPDTLIEGHIGVGQTPAFRGLAYCVFEDLALGEFGNRIPNLSFEVISQSDVKIIDVAANLLERVGVSAEIDPSYTEDVKGFSLSGRETFRDGVNALLPLFPMSVSERSSTLHVAGPGTQTAMTLTQADLGAALDTQIGERLSLEYEHATDLPGEIRVSYSEPANDFQSGMQRAQSASLVSNDDSVRLDTSLVLETGQARGLAAATLSRMRQERISLQANLGLAASLLDPGDIISVETVPGRFDLFDVQSITADGALTTVEAVSKPVVSSDMQTGLTASSGLVAYSTTVGAPTISADIFELPATPQFGAEPKIFASVNRLGGQVSSAGLYLSDDGGVDYKLAASLPVAGVTGTTLNGLEDRNPALPDLSSTLEVQLDHEDMALYSRPRLALLNGANLARVGTELLQFEIAQATESGTFLLSGLLRGRAGTDHSLVGSATGQRFILLQSGDLGSQSFDQTSIGSSYQAKILPAGQVLADAPAHSVSLGGAALKPFAPAHLKARFDSTAGVTSTWTRRSRVGFAWLDGADAPLGEASLAFRIGYSAGGQTFTRDVTAEGDTLTTTELTTHFGSSPLTLTITVAQISDVVGAGKAASVTLQIS